MSDALDKKRLMTGVIPYLGIKNAGEAIEFYKRAFGAVVIDPPVKDEEGLIMNTGLAINDGVLMLMDRMEQFGDSPSGVGPNLTMQLVVADGKAWWDRAVEAGCEITDPYGTKFWGDDYGRLKDPYGIEWAILQPSAEQQAAVA